MALELEAQFVKTGLWTNLDAGPVMGKTITTDPQTGNVVVAILAVVSTLGTAHLWNLLSFAYHQARANGRPSDGLFQQQQAMLRSLPTPSTVMADAVKLWWAWRKNADKPFLRSLMLAALALIFTAATVAASIFSSLIVTTGVVDVLVDSPLCGGINTTTAAWHSVKYYVDQTSGSYAEACYLNTTTLPIGCSSFMQPNIPLQVENVPCPFLNTTWCNTTDAVRLDTGLIDVGKTFGLNLAAHERVSFRKRTTCTILPIEGAYDVVNVQDYPLLQEDRPALPEEQVLIMYYGPTFSRQLPVATYIFSLFVSNTTHNPQTFDGPEHLTYPGAGYSWYPKPGLAVKNGTGDMFWKPVAPNSVVYENPVDDPLYSAHIKTEMYDLQKSANVTFYKPDHPLKAAGCQQEHQFCHARDGKADFCTPLTYRPSYKIEPFDFPELNNSVQRVVLENLLIASWLYTTSDAKRNKAASRQRSHGNAAIESIPDGFWKEEVIAWEQEAMASLQIAMTQYAIGHKVRDDMADRYWMEPKTEGEKRLCKAQKMKKTGGFVNINLFGLVFVLTLATLAMIVDITLLKFLIYLARFRRQLGPRVERWIQDGVWQLQRRAYEGVGQRDWTNLESEIPLTKNGQMMQDLPILWVPGKSPMVIQTRSFESVGSQETLRSDMPNIDQENRSVRPGSRWYTCNQR